MRWAVLQGSRVLCVEQVQMMVVVSIVVVVVRVLADDFVRLKET